jgi:hypothetical protein
MELFKVYVNANGKTETFYMEPAEHYLQVVKQAYIRFGSQAVSKIVVVKQ